MDYRGKPRLTCLFWITVWTILATDPTLACPPECTCSSSRGGRTQCSGKSLTSISQLDINPDIARLDLSDNALTVITNHTFARMKKLTRLILKNNQISHIDEGAFEGLENLEQLDLSNNLIENVNTNAFTGLPSLQKLSLGNNKLKTIPEGTFDVLTSLARVDFQSDYLNCDCNLKWIVKWRRNSEPQIRIKDSTVCAFPEELKDKPVKTLERNDLHCGWPVEVSDFSITPSSSQVVFEGDKLPFECHAKFTDPSMKMVWVREGKILETNKSEGLYVFEKKVTGKTGGLTIVHLMLEHLTPKHSGVWKCAVLTEEGNSTKSVNIIVISDDTIYCPEEETRSNKGGYSWSKTVQGLRRELACQSGPASDYEGDTPAQAYRHCSSQGNWEAVDDTRCQYSSQVTRVLEQYAELGVSNITKAKADVLKKYIKNQDVLQDKMDIIFTSKIIKALSKQARHNEKLSDIVLHIVSTIMDADEELLRQAQTEDKACTRLIKAVEELPKQLLQNRNMMKKTSKNIVIEAHVVTPDMFSGMTCAVYRDLEARRETYVDDSLLCTTQQTNFTGSAPHREGKVIESVIHIPSNIFTHVRCLYQICQDNNLSYKLQIISYKNAKLFPIIGEEYEKTSISSSIISAKIVSLLCLAGVAVENTSQPIVIQLRDSSRGSKRAVYWDFQANNELGAWTDRGCHVTGTKDQLSTIECNHLTNFAIMKGAPISPSQIWVMIVGFLKLSPIIYAGTGFLALCMLAIIITYMCTNKNLKMPRKAKHSIANLCLSILLVFATFTLGIKAKEPVIACQVVGIAIHYFSLCTLFWITIISFFMSKKFAKALYPPPPPTEPLEGPPPPRTVVTVYLVGWGVSIIICGISGAINWLKYAENPDFCFLSLDVGILVFYIPVGLLVLINAVLFIRIICILQSTPHKPLDPIDEPETEETHVNELELAAAEGSIVNAAASQVGSPESVAATERTNLTGVTAISATSDTSKMDVAYRPISQLRATVILLFLYMLTWAAGAFAVSLPFPHVVPYQELTFSCVYGFLTVVLGVYMFVFYCVGRAECRHAWRDCSCCCCCSRRPRAPREPTPDTTSNLARLPLANGHIHSGSDFEGSSYTSKSNQGSSFRYAPKKTSNINLVPSITATEPSVCSIQEIQQRFYNPRQNGAAKRYWEKHKQQRLLHSLNADFNMDSGHSSHGEGRHQGKRANRDSYHGNSSDANTQLNIEINIQPKQPGKLSPHPPSTEQNQNIYNSLQRRQQQKSPGNLDMEKPLLTLGPLLERNKIPPVGGTGSPPPAGESSLFSKFPLTNTHNVNIYPILTPPTMAGIDYSSSCSSHTMPRLHKHREKEFNVPIKEGMQRNGSVPRLRDFDGQSAVSQEQGVASPAIIAEVMEMYKPPKPLFLDGGKRDLPGRSQQPTPEGDHQQGRDMDRSMERNSNASKTGSLDKNSNTKASKQTDNFLDQLEQRIPQQHRTSGSDKTLEMNPVVNDNDIPTEDDTDLSQSDIRLLESAAESANNSHDKRHSHHSNKPRTCKKHGRPPKREPKSWDDEFKDMPPKPAAAYTFVNHDYRDRVITKLIKNNAETGLIENGLLDDASLAWMPRSVSAYEYNDPAESLLDTSSSSSSEMDSEGMAEVWVLQKKKKKKFKKETSV